MRILVVDDEPPARERLRALVEDLRLGEVVGEAADGTAALELAQSRRADLVLLDIRMPGMDGIEAARHLSRLEQPPAVIFTTAYDTHALEAFDAQAVGYLLKPVRRERLREAVERAARPTRAQLEALGAGASGGAAAARTHIGATLHGSLKLVPVSEIRFFRAEYKYVTARHPGGELVIEDSLAVLEREFGERLLRVHRNALVARAHVRALERSRSGRLVVRFDGVDDEVEVSRRLVGAVRRALRG